MVPDCGAYSIRPYPDGRLFSSKWVGAQKHTPLQTFPSRERMQVAGLANNHPKATARALSCPIVGRIQYAPTLTVKKTGSFFEATCFQSPYFSSEWVGRKSIRPPRRPRQGDERKTCIRHRRWRLGGVFDTPLQPGTSMERQNAIPCPL